MKKSTMDSHLWCMVLLVLVGVFNSDGAEFLCKSDMVTPELGINKNFQETCNEEFALIIDIDFYYVYYSSGSLSFILRDMKEENPIFLSSFDDFSGETDVTEYVKYNPVINADTTLRLGLGKLCAEDVNLDFRICIVVRVDFNYSNAGADFGLGFAANNGPQVNLYDSGNSLGTQLREQLVGFEVYVSNDGYVPLLNTTFDSPYTVVVYLRRRYENRHWEWNDNCYSNVPDLTIRDAVLGTFTFTEGLDVYGHLNIPEERLNEINVTAKGEPVICGDAELIFQADPFHVINDSNRCNDFQILDVQVHCSHSSIPRCEAMMDPDTFGYEAYIAYYEESEVKAYRYKAEANHQWSKIDTDTDYRTLQNMGRMKLGSQMLGDLVEDPIICEQILGSLDDDLDETDSTDARYNASTTQFFQNLESLIAEFELNVSTTIIYQIPEMGITPDTVEGNALIGLQNGMWRSYYSYSDSSEWYKEDTARLIEEFVTTAVKTMMSIGEHTDHWSLRYDAHHLAERISNLRSAVHPTLNGRFSRGIKNIFPAIIDFAQLLVEYANSYDTSQCIRGSPVWKKAERALISLYKLPYILLHDAQQFDPPMTEMCKSKALSWYVWTTNHRSASKDMMPYQHSMDNWVEYDNDPCTKRMYAEKPQRVNVFWKVDDIGIWKGIFDEESSSNCWRLVGFCTCSDCQNYQNYDNSYYDSQYGYGYSSTSWYDSMT